MRSHEFRARQEAKKKKWAREIVSRWMDPDTRKGRREVGKVTNTHTFCGCFYCRRPKLLDIPTRKVRRSHDADRDCLDD
ncbi:MAG TPA: hypothetical protein VNI20_11845 [Fimbriimonadaceae bacterium]|nr:hypothetical protein [Fimbriimonadaceae bacterium]